MCSATKKMDDPGGQPPGPSRRQRRAVGLAILSGVIGAGIWLLIGQSASYPRLLRAIEHADGAWLVLSVAGAGISYLGYALLYQAIAHVEEGPRPGFRLAIRMSVVVFGSAVVATAAGRIGSEYWSLRRMREQAPRAWSRVLALNTAIWAVLAILTALASLVLLAGGPGRAPTSLALVWLGILPLCAAPALALSAERRRAWTQPRGGRLQRACAAVVHSLVISRRVFLGREERVRGWAGGLIYWAGQLVVVWAALRAFGTHLSYAPLLLGYTTGYAATILPLPAGGAGGVDAAAVYALTLVGVPLGPALLATLVQRLFTYWLPLGVAVASLRLIRRLGADLSKVPHPGAAG